jgi:glycerol-3-phosphate O-acyltransferase/dihydroxyacetone phosphate acyltransferase
MALSAMALNPELDVKIVPTGLHYFNPDRFRSRACVEFGHPISISNELVEQYKVGGVEKRKACETLLETIHAAIRGVTVNAPDYETLQVIQAIRRFFKPKDPKMALVQKLDLSRSLVKVRVGRKSAKSYSVTPVACLGIRQVCKRRTDQGPQRAHFGVQQLTRRLRAQGPSSWKDWD